MKDYLKDLLFTIVAWLTRNDSYRKGLENTAKVLQTSPAVCRFIVALVQQVRLSQRNHYKRIQRGSVKGVWFGKEASYKSESELTGGSGPIVLYVHGGAFISGQTKMWSDFNFDIIEQHKKKFSKDLRIFCVDYTLAPDKSFPHQWTECQAAFDYLTRSMKVDPARLFISGDSAGGNLALQTLFELENAKSLAGAILFSPWVLPASALASQGLVQDTDGVKATETSSDHINAKNDYISGPFGDKGIVCYVGKSMTLQTAYSSKQINPLRRTKEEFESLPDLLIPYGHGECLRDQILEFVEKAKASSVSVETLSEETGVHDWPLSSKLTPTLAQYHHGLETISAWIEKKMIHTSAALEKQ